MSAENVAVVRSIYDSFSKGDVPGALNAMDPDIEWIEGREEFLPQRGTHRGPQAVAEKVFQPMFTVFDEFAVIPASFHDAGDVVVVEGRAQGRTRGGNTLDAPAAWVWTVRNGAAVRNVNYHDTDAWRQALIDRA